MTSRTPITSIRNIGPAMEREFLRAGLSSAEDIQALGADAAYSKLLSIGVRPHFIGYYALVMGLQGRKWNDLDRTEKEILRKRFDEIVAGRKADQASELDAFLDRIGVIDTAK